MIGWWRCWRGRTAGAAPPAPDLANLLRGERVGSVCGVIALAGPRRARCPSISQNPGGEAHAALVDDPGGSLGRLRARAGRRHGGVAGVIDAAPSGAVARDRHDRPRDLLGGLASLTLSVVRRLTAPRVAHCGAAWRGRASPRKSRRAGGQGARPPLAVRWGCFIDLGGAVTAGQVLRQLAFAGSCSGRRSGRRPSCARWRRTSSRDRASGGSSG